MLEREKPTNWHQPLQPDQFRRSYLRGRAGSVRELIRANESDVSNSWDIYASCSNWEDDEADAVELMYMVYEYDERQEAVSEGRNYGFDEKRPAVVEASRTEELIYGAWSEAMSEGFNELGGRYIEWLPGGEQLPQASRFSVGAEEAGSLTPEEIASSLAEQVHDEAWKSSRTSLWRELLSHKSTRALFVQVFSLIQRTVSSFDSFLTSSANCLLNVLLLERFWVRPISSWVPPQDSSAWLDSLVEHLFVKFPVPAFLYRSWHIDETNRSVAKWLCWFILIGQGGSLHRTGRCFADWHVSKRFQHFLHLIGDFKGLTIGFQEYGNLLGWQRDPERFCMYAEVLRLGGTRIEFEPLDEDPAFWVDPTNTVDVDGSFLEFWRETVHWLVHHHDELAEHDTGVILRWAAHMFHETRRTDRRFSWSGRTPTRAHEAAQEYQRSLRSPFYRRSCRWARHGWNWNHTDGSGSVWSVHELNSSADLLEEGHAMHHCVASYADRCARGDAAILSLRCDGQRAITIQVNLRTRGVVQALGFGNRFPNASEKDTLDLWRQEVLGWTDMPERPSHASQRRETSARNAYVPERPRVTTALRMSMREIRARHDEALLRASVLRERGFQWKEVASELEKEGYRTRFGLPYSHNGLRSACSRLGLIT